MIHLTWLFFLGIVTAEDFSYAGKECFNESDGRLESCHPYLPNELFSKVISPVKCNDGEKSIVTVSGSIQYAEFCQYDRLTVQYRPANGRESNEDKTFCGEFSSFLEVRNIFCF